MDKHRGSILKVGAVLLAAGAGSRMGNRPKSLLQLDGIPLIQRQIIALSGAGVDEVVVVIGHYAQSISLAIQEFSVTVVQNPQPEDGQISSLRLGLQALSPNVDAVLIALADQPLVNAQDICDLIDAYNKRSESIQVVQPEVDGQLGNPVIFNAQVRTQILAGDANMGGKQWQAAHPEAVRRWATSNQRYCTDVDTLEDIEALAERTGYRLRWPSGLVNSD